ncbi:cellulose biosynthesis cyclic di-GMP-binding regulatory protein BcsB [Crassaminicella thermophila]|uniref:Cellulose biosynthesis cyclic di-GMP-binding regulatory protein BcsB n=1 Tax=Crassaminicella thermophila TaxID=2599308 RepID=A0A5C0SET2_CRATE|nr:cellulose biosynthesis cyclic di-GMP-binding regulatory protein BcsB [Crassaminicella thermophila]QEK12841.1 cellulose biosynthesis cyclic di-GMP-binding regulatory protein BcsB [Crassaminicella thermophila]
MKKIIVVWLIIFLLNPLGYFTAYGYAETNERYTIQIGAFKAENNADKTYNKLIQNGYAAYKIKSNLIKVYVGNYKTREEAVNVLRDIEKIGINGIVIRKNFDMILPNDKNISSKPIKSINEYFSKTNEKNYRFFDNDVHIEGVYGSYISFFTVDKYWKIEDGNYMELILSQSDIEKCINSTLTIYINNYPIYSTRLQNKKKNREVIKVRIPIEYIREGFNEVKIRTYSRISTTPCLDEINPANWIVYHKESYIHIAFREKIDENSLKEYPYPYLKESKELPVNSLIIIPDDFKNEHLKAAMLLSTNFGQKQAFKNLDIKIEKFSDSKDKDKNNIIFIGSSNNLPNEISLLLTTEEKEHIKKEALIKEVNSPYNKNFKMLLILSDDYKSIIKAVKSLTVEDMVMQMKKNTQFISKNLDIVKKNQKVSDYISLKDMGYSDVFIEGLFRQNAKFGINIPKNWIIQDDAKLYLKMRYSQILNFDKSVMTVYINNIPIGSKRLSYENANDDVFEITIPKDVKDSTYYDLKVTFYLDIEGVECDTRLDSNSWVYLSNESFLYLPHSNRKDSFFEYYSSPFIQNNKFNDLLMVLSEKPSSEEISIAGNIMAFLGHETNDLDDFEVITADEYNNTYKDKNMIVIGLPKENRLIDNMNKNMHIKFNEDYTKFLSNEKITLLEDFDSKVATIQLIKSPYNHDKKVLVITSMKNEGLGWAKKYLTDFNLIVKLKGNATIIDELGNVFCKYYGKSIENQIEIKERNIEHKNIPKEIFTSKLKYFTIFLIVTLTIIIIISIFLIRRKK